MALCVSLRGPFRGQTTLPNPESVYVNAVPCGSKLVKPHFVHKQGLSVETLPQLKRYNSYSGAVGEGDFAVYDPHSVEKVVSDQKVAVEVSEVGKRGKLGCG